MNETLKRVGLFIGITYTLSWLIMRLFWGYDPVWVDVPPLIVTMTITVFKSIPMISAIIVQKFICKEPLKKPLGISFKLNRWWLVAWLLPLLIAFATLGVSLLIPGITFSLEMIKSYFAHVSPQNFIMQIFWIFLSHALFGGFLTIIYSILEFGEEVGWRGFLLKEFSRMNLWKSSAIIGLIWGIWHIALVQQVETHPLHQSGDIFRTIIFYILISPIFSYIRLKSKSVIATAIMYGSFTLDAGLATMMVKGSDLIIGIGGVAGFIVLLIVNLYIFLFDSSIRGKPLNVIIEEAK